MKKSIAISVALSFGIHFGYAHRCRRITMNLLRTEFFTSIHGNERNYMKTIFSGLIVGLLAVCRVQAQGTLYYSNLGQSATSTTAVASDSWLAEPFGTGPNSGGYLLDSVQLAMADATGNPSGFTVMIYSYVLVGGGYVPGSSLGTLQGSLNPATAGIYDYTPSSSLVLSPRTSYSIVITSATPSSEGTYYWNRSAYRPSSSYGWGAISVVQSSNGTSGWTTFSDEGFAQFSISAEPIPEPSLLWLGLLGCGVWFYAYRTHKNHRPA